MCRSVAVLFASSLAAAVILASCGSGPHSADEKYYFITANTKIPYWQTAHDGWRQAASDMKVGVEFTGPDTYDPAAEQQQLRDVIKKKPSGILISTTDPNMMKADIDSAIDQGIPVITVDADSPGSKRITFIGTDNYRAGVMGGEAAVKALNGKGNVVVFTMPNQANLNERLHGYKDTFADHPGIKITDVIDIKGDPRVAFDTTNDIILKKKPVDAFVCLEAQAGKEVADVLDRNKVTGKVVVAMDTDDATLDWIKKGMIVATIAQKPYTMTYFGLHMLDDIHHQKLSLSKNYAEDPFAPVPSFVDTGLSLVNKSNMDAFIQARNSAKQTK